MKLRTLSILILTAFSINALAYQGQGFRIISEKVTHSPDFKDGGFREISPKTMYVNALSWAYNSEGRTYEYVKVRGDHNVSISNSTRATQQYTYSYTLSCESAFENFERTIEIYPNGLFTDNSSSYGTVQKENSGTFGIHVMTKVTGGESATHTADAILRVIS